MKKNRIKFIVFILFLVAELDLFAANWEDFLYDSHNNPVRRENDSPRHSLLSTYSPSEFGAKFSFKPSDIKASKIKLAVSVVPDRDDEENGESEPHEACCLDHPVVTPSQEMAASLSRFVLLGAADAFRTVETSSPKRKVDSILDCLDEAEHHPERLYSVLKENPKKIEQLRKIIQGFDEQQEELGSAQLTRSLSLDSKKKRNE
jgi:hypothetical protein